MTHAKPNPASAVVESLVTEIKSFEGAIANWDESQKLVVEGLKKSIEALHKEALTRLIRSLKEESMSALRHAVEDEVVYALFRYHGLVKAPPGSLESRVRHALSEVRLGLQSHNGDVELVAIELPDTVKVKLLGTCSSCPASSLTLTEGVEKTIKKHCPEIERVEAVANSPTAPQVKTTPLPKGGREGFSAYQTSPFSGDRESDWIPLTGINGIPTDGVLAVDVEGLKLIVGRLGDRVIAYRNSCSHLAMSIDRGKVEDGILNCPFHGFQYRLETGECLTAPEMSLEPYPVKLKSDRVWVKAA